MSRIDCNEIVKRMEERLSADYQIELHEASTVQLHNALAEAVMAVTAKDCRESRRAHERVRRAYYFSAEYLMGRSVFSNLYNLGILDEMRTLLRERGADISAMEEIDDAALGNGGLGRLAACYLDSAATLGIPLEGYGLRYKFGLFKQTFVDGFQVEKADDWLKYGDPWSKRRDDKTVTVEFADQKVLAVPYDMPVFGYNTAHSGHAAPVAERTDRGIRLQSVQRAGICPCRAGKEHGGGYYPRALSERQHIRGQAA